MKLDVLAFAAHPDDCELSCSGTLAKLKSQGKKIGIVDLTRGELGTRGTVEIRNQEAEASSKILKLDARENLDMRDGFIEISEANKLKVVQMLRKYKPTIVFANAIVDRHTDHGRAAELIEQSIFISGLVNVKTTLNGKEQESWRPKQVFHYVQFQYIKPDVIVDITANWETKEASIKAFGSQFYDPKSKEPKTLISSEGFMDIVRSRAIEYGSAIGVKYGEGFTTHTAVNYNFLNLL